MEILPRYFSENSYGLLTNSDIESLYFTTMSSQNQTTISIGSNQNQNQMGTYRKSPSSINEIDCTVHIEVPIEKKVKIYPIIAYYRVILAISPLNSRYSFGSIK